MSDLYDRFHESTGAAKKSETLKGRTERPVDSLSPFERRQEFYGLLKTVASPGIVKEVTGFRRRYELGIVGGTAESPKPAIAEYGAEASEAIAAGEPCGSSTPSTARCVGRSISPELRGS